MYLIILQCGDIEIQPGPERYPCGICSKNVTWRAKAIQCEDCEVWYHSNCMNIGPKTYSDLGRSSVVWLCNTCGIPNVATCTLLDLDSFSNSNPFDELAGIDSEGIDYSQQTHTSTPIRNLKLKTQVKDLNLTQIPKNESAFNENSHFTKTNLNLNRNNGSTSSHENSVITEPESSLQDPQAASYHSNEQSSSCSRDSESRTFKGDNLSFCVINFQSIGNKKTELHNLIVSSEPDVILGNETHLDPATLDAEILPYNIPPQHKYRLFRKDRKELFDKGGGGVIVMIKPGLSCEECPDLDSECEIKWVKATTSKNNNIPVIFLQICFYESRDSLGQNSLHPKLEVVHPIWVQF